jgi:hypothetical protein
MRRVVGLRVMAPNRPAMITQTKKKILMGVLDAPEAKPQIKPEPMKPL